MVSGADEVAGWNAESGSWWAPLTAEPKKLLRDGRPWTEFNYDAAAKRIMVKTGGDPRLHLFETVVRENSGIDLAGAKRCEGRGRHGGGYSGRGDARREVDRRPMSRRRASGHWTREEKR